MSTLEFLPLSVVDGRTHVPWNPPSKYGDDMKLWAEHARHILAGLAETGSTVTYRNFHNMLAEAIGESSPLMWRKWTGPVLGEVAVLNKLNEEPLLTSLVVMSTPREDGEVAPGGYANSVLVRYGYTPDLPIHHAKIERAKAFRLFGAR